MKFFRIVLMLMFITINPTVSFAQPDTVKNLSKFEEFSSKTGRLFKIETSRLGKTKDVTVSKRKVTDIESGDYKTALYLEFKASGIMYGMTYSSIIIDSDEVPGFLNTLKYVYATVFPDKCKEDCPIYTYESSGGVELNVFKVVGAYGSNWHVTFTRYGLASAGGEIDNDRLEDFIKILEQYK